jgi:hypothetical protein
MKRKKKEYCFKAVSTTINCIRADQKADNSTRADKKEILVCISRADKMKNRNYQGDETENTQYQWLTRSKIFT